MNTLDTEWEKEELVRKAERDIEFVVSNPDMYDISVQVKNIVRNLISSRDTYWKDRVRKTVGKIEESARTQDTSYEYGEGTYEGMMHSIFILKDITNEDNLKWVWT